MSENAADNSGSERRRSNPMVSLSTKMFRDSFTRRGTYQQYTQAIDQAEQERVEHEGGQVIDNYRLELRKFMTKSTEGKYYSEILMYMSVLSCFEYMYQTYLTDNQFSSQYFAAIIAELIFAMIFGVDWALNLFLADYTMEYLISAYSMIDIVTVVSIFATLGKTHIPLSHLESSEDYVFYILFALKTVRMLRALWFSKKLVQIEDAVERYIGQISLSIMVMTLFFAALIQYLEETTSPFPFHTWMYYIWVTIATVGYGDITPSTTLGRIAVMVMIAVAVVSVPKATNELVEKMNLQSVYMRATYHPKSKNSKHIIICVDLSSTSLKEFFAELFHEDHENVDLSAVILLPSAPSVDLIFLMRNPTFSMQLTYLEGSALVETDLKRAKAEKAVAIFVMTNKFSAVPDEEDAKSILLNLSIKRYLASFKRSNMLYCMQLLKPENKRHLVTNDFSGLDDNDLVVCLNEIKMGAMAKAVMYPGVNTLLMNLVSSFSDDDLTSAETIANSPTSPRGTSLESELNSGTAKEWIKEYMKGCGWEIYTTALSPIFIGAKFCELSYALYDKVGVVLFALQITDYSTNISRVLLNPADYIIPNQDKFGIEAFVIAENQASSDLSFMFKHDTAVDVVHQNLHLMASVIKSSIKDYRSYAEVQQPNNHPNRRKNVLPQFSPPKTKGRRNSREQPATSSNNATAATASEGNQVEGESSTQEPKKVGEGGEKKKTSYWNKLKRSALLKKRVESYSYQEILHKLEDEHFQSNYFVRPFPLELNQCLVRSSVIDEVPYINNHIIIIGRGLGNLFDLIRPLRAKYAGSLRHIVILYPYDIPQDVWHRISIFDAILVVRGSALEESNLRRAGIFRASQVVVLADGSFGNSSSHGMDALVDSDAIFAYQHVKRMNPNTQVVIEIVNQSNIGYLDSDLGYVRADNYKFSPQFAAGVLFTTSSLDSIICQTYYNPQIIKVVNKLLSGVDSMERSDLAAKATREVDKSNGRLTGDHSAGGDDSDTSARMTDSAPGSGKSSSGKRGQSKPRLRRAISRINSVEGSCLYQMNIPENLPKRTYGELYKYLVGEGRIPLGLLRGTFSSMNMGPKANRMPYVYTNPGRNTELFTCDRIFVLSTKPVQVTTTLNVKDWLLDIQMQQSREKEAKLLASKKKSLMSNTLPRSLLGEIGKDPQIDKHFQKLNYRFDRLSKDVFKQLGEIRAAVLGEPLPESPSKVQGKDAFPNSYSSDLEATMSPIPPSRKEMDSKPSFPMSDSDADSVVGVPLLSTPKRHASIEIGNAKKGVGFSSLIDNLMSGKQLIRLTATDADDESEGDSTDSNVTRSDHEEERKQPSPQLTKGGNGDNESSYVSESDKVLVLNVKQKPDPMFSSQQTSRNKVVLSTNSPQAEPYPLSARSLETITMDGLMSPHRGNKGETIPGPSFAQISAFSIDDQLSDVDIDSSWLPHLADDDNQSIVSNESKAIIPGPTVDLLKPKSAHKVPIRSKSANSNR